MLGEKLGELTGRTTGVRILPGDDYRYVKMEVSIEEQGSILGVPVTGSSRRLWGPLTRGRVISRHVSRTRPR